MLIKNKNEIVSNLFIIKKYINNCFQTKMYYMDIKLRIEQNKLMLNIFDKNVLKAYSNFDKASKDKLYKLYNQYVLNSVNKLKNIGLSINVKRNNENLIYSIVINNDLNNIATLIRIYNN